MSSPKKRRYSVGVSRQYCGRLGKADNSQSSVMMGYLGANVCALVDYGLFMPHERFGDDYAALCKRCKIPDDIGFETKNEMFSEMIKKAVDSGNFQVKYVGADCS